MTAKGWGRFKGGGIEQKGERTHGHGQQCGDCSGREVYKGNMGKNAIKKKKPR